MKEKVNIIQFLPYFPPHKWGLETHAQERGFWREKKWYWNVINVVFDLWYFPSPPNKGDKGGLDKLILIPALEIIPTFPIPKFRKKEFRKTLNKIKNVISNDIVCEKSKWIIATRTRFFTSSLIGWVFAKRKKLLWCHMEHGSSYVKLWSWRKNIIAWIYDQIIWRRIFKKCSILVPISKACEIFTQKFTKKKSHVIYRWMDFINTIDIKQKPSIDLKKKFWNKIIIWFIGRIYAWKNVESLIKSYYMLEKKTQEKIQIIIIGDGPDLEKIKKTDTHNKTFFVWGKEYQEALLLQKQFDIHIHTSSPWWGIASTLIQALYLCPLIIATPYEWANEIISNKNGVLLKDDSTSEIKRWIEEWIRLLDTKKNSWSTYNQKLFQSMFSWEKNIEKYFNIFK